MFLDILERAAINKFGTEINRPQRFASEWRNATSHAKEAFFAMLEPENWPKKLLATPIEIVGRLVYIIAPSKFPQDHSRLSSLLASYCIQSGNFLNAELIIY